MPTSNKKEEEEEKEKSEKAEEDQFTGPPLWVRSNAEYHRANF